MGLLRLVAITAVAAVLSWPADPALAQHATSRKKAHVAGATSAPSLPTQELKPGEAPLEQEGGTFTVPVLINNAITLRFTLDSGAADVSIPRDVVTTLIRAGTISENDFTGAKSYVLADGSKITSLTFRIRSMTVGGLTLHNVAGSIADENGSLLLGQSFLSRLSTWSIDNRRHVLIFNQTTPPAAGDGLPAAAPPMRRTVRAVETAQVGADAVLCTDGSRQPFELGPPFCDGHGGAAGVTVPPQSYASRPVTGTSSGNTVVCRDGALQEFGSGPPYCIGHGGMGGIR